MPDKLLMAVRPRNRVAKEFVGVSRTKQSMAEACDINRIMGRYLKSGTVDHLSLHGASYGVATSQTFHEAMEIVRKAEEMFNDLSSDVRKRFHHDPAEFLEFVNAVDEDGAPANLEEMRRLKLALPEKEPDPIPGPREVVVVEDRREAYDDSGPVERPVARGSRAPAAKPPAK